MSIGTVQYRPSTKYEYRYRTVSAIYKIRVSVPIQYRPSTKYEYRYRTVSAIYKIRVSVPYSIGHLQNMSIGTVQYRPSTKNMSIGTVQYRPSTKNMSIGTVQYRPSTKYEYRYRPSTKYEYLPLLVSVQWQLAHSPPLSMSCCLFCS